MKNVYLKLILLVIVISLVHQIAPVPLKYPKTNKSKNITDIYHGKIIEDEYRWLEDDNSKQTKAWVQKQNAFTDRYLRKIPYRKKIENRLTELISGSLLEVAVKFNLRNSLSVPDTSVMVEGDKSYVYKINEENIANKTEIKTGIRTDKSIEIISGLTEGDIIVAEGLKKVRPRGKIKPIKK